MIEVVTVWAPRPEHPKWQEYMPLLELQAKTVRRAGHHHRVVTDTDMPGYNTLRVDLPKPLLKALVAGQLAYMKKWKADHRVVMLDIDCMVTGSLERAFTGFDVGLTLREHDTQPIQNGAMYFEGTREAKVAAVAMFERTLEMCGSEWGEDQEAMARAVAPPKRWGTAMRFGARFDFLHVERHNHADKHSARRRLTNRVFVEHFKGDTKHQAADYVERLLRT